MKDRAIQIRRAQPSSDFGSIVILTLAPHDSAMLGHTVCLIMRYQNVRVPILHEDPGLFTMLYCVNSVTMTPVRPSQYLSCKVSYVHQPCASIIEYLLRLDRECVQETNVDSLAGRIIIFLDHRSWLGQLHDTWRTKLPWQGDLIFSPCVVCWTKSLLEYIGDL